jgi:hypothetical protein
VVFHGIEHFGPIANERVEEAEKALGIRFPESYKEFLRQFGAAWLRAPIEIAGLPDKPASGDTPLFSDVVAVNRGRRGQSAHVKISDDGSEYSFYLDTSAFDAHGECCVRILGPGRENLEVASSFVEFVEKVARRGVEAVLR